MKNHKDTHSHHDNHSHDTHDHHGDDHEHEHEHNHDHHSHGHTHHHNAPVRILIFAILLTLAFAIIEFIGGSWAGSLALVGDSGHMFSDSLSLVIAAFAAWIANRPPTAQHSYGLGRAEVLAAWVSSLITLIISIAVIAEAVDRIHNPITVEPKTVIIIASIGICINAVLAWMLTRTERTLNMRAALIHVIGDLLGSFAALTAGVVIWKTGWFPIDPMLSIFIGILILISSLRLFRESMLVLMEGVPLHINMANVNNDLMAIGGVKEIHDLHIWTLSSGTIALSAHVFINELSSWQGILSQIRGMLKKKYKIDHVTLQPEPDIIDCQPCQEPSANKLAAN